MDQVAPIVKSPIELIVRCFAEKKGDQWQAFSVEFGLAVQGDTFEEVAAKLETMTACYVDDALSRDRKFASQLLRRKAIVSVRLKYLIYSLLNRIVPRQATNGIVFDEPMPLAFAGGYPAV